MPTPNFFSLLREIRDIIYRYLLKHDGDSKALLEVCHQIRSELLIPLMERPRPIPWLRLNQWVAECPPILTPLVRRVHLVGPIPWLAEIWLWRTRLPQGMAQRYKPGSWEKAYLNYAGDSVSSHPLFFSPPASQLRMAPPPLPRSVSQFVSDIQAFKSLRSLFVPLSYAGAAETSFILELLVTHIPTLLDFGFRTSTRIQLDFLQLCPQLRDLRLPPFATTRSADLKKMLDRFENLEQVGMTRSAQDGFEDENDDDISLEDLTLTPSIVTGLNPLRGFKIYDRTDVSPPIVTVEMIQAVGSHASSLVSLGIIVDGCTDYDVAVEIKALLLSLTHLKRLRMRLWLTDETSELDILGAVPDTVQDRDVSVHRWPRTSLVI